MKKRLLSIILAIAMILSLIPAMSVSASSDEWLTFTIASKRMYPTRYVYLFNFVITNDGVPYYGYASSNIPAGKWDYNESTHTLNLYDGFDFETSGLVGMYLTNDDNAPFTINIDGNVKISGRDFGLYVEGEAIFTGNGTLTLENTSDNYFSNYADSSRPAALLCYEGITVSDNVTIVARGTSAGIDGAPINVTDNAKIIATGNRAAALSYGEEFSNGTDISVKGGTDYECFENLTEVNNNTAEEANLTDGQYNEDYYTLMAGDKIVKSAVMINIENDDFLASVYYLDRTWSGTEIEETKKQVFPGYFNIVSSDTQNIENGWYVVISDVTNTNRITVSGTANLILADGCTLNLPNGIELSSGNALNIYGQTNDTGRLQATVPLTTPGYAGIGSGNIQGTSGNLTVYGGDIYAKGGTDAAGIGGGSGENGGSFTMYGGAVEAQGNRSNGIGAGYQASNSGEFNVYGNVNVYAGDSGPEVLTTATDYAESRRQYVNITKKHLHIWEIGDLISEATCLKPAVYEEKCTICGETGMVEVGEKGKHNFVNYVCTLCDTKEFVIDANDMLTAYNGNGGDVVIPSDTYIDGKLITIRTIGYSVFEDRTDITSVVLPEYLSGINNSAFAGCTNLTSVVFPECLNRIENSAFAGCTKLTSVVLHEYVNRIGGSAFAGCTNLISVVLSGDVSEIGSSAFAGCAKLTSIEIPGGLYYIDDYTFEGCTGLTSVVIHEGVEEIWNSAFAGCTSLTNIEIPESVRDIHESAFIGCTALKSIEIPESVEIIKDGTFSNCTGLTSVVIPEGVVQIGGRAFEYCTGLKSISIPASVRAIDPLAFYHSGLTTITVTDNIPSFLQNNVFSGTNISTVNYPCGDDLDKIKAAYGQFVRSDATYNPIHDYSSQGVCKVCGYKIFEFVSKNLALDSALAFKFKGYLHDPNPAADAYMEFKIGNIRTVNIPLSDAVKDEKGRYVFTCYLNVLEVDEKIEAFFHDGEYTVERENPLSVTDYLDLVLANHQGGTAEDAVIVNLVNTISNFAHYAQIALDETHSEYEVGNGGKYVGTDARTEITLHTADELKAFEAIKTVASDYTAIKATARSLVLDDKTAVVLYITPASKDYVPTINITDRNGDNVAFTVTKQTNGNFKVVIRDVAAHQLAEIFTVDIDNGKLVYTNLSALSYAYSVLSNGSSEAYKMAVSALYDYYIATVEYQNGGHNFGELIPEVPATCTETGLAAHYCCSICGKYFDENKIESTLQALTIAAKGHTFGTYFFNKTEHWQECTVCGAPTDREPHSYSDNGNGKASCTKCDANGNIFNRNGNTITGLTDIGKTLPKIVVPEGVTVIDIYAFRYCTAIEELVVPDSVTTIGSRIVGDCTNLKTVTIGGGITSLGVFSFFNLPNLTTVTLNSAELYLDYLSFDTCEKLEKIVLNGPAISLHFGSISDCHSLKTIEYNGTIAQWQACVSDVDSPLKGIPSDCVVYCTDGTCDVDGNVL